MEFKGTKGKWILRENKSTIMSEKQCLIARVFDGKGTALLADKNQSDTIVEANALLMSKAPEMLQELIKGVEILKAMGLGDTERCKRKEQLIKEATEL